MQPCATPCSTPRKPTSFFLTTQHFSLTTCYNCPLTPFIYPAHFHLSHITPPLHARCKKSFLQKALPTTLNHVIPLDFPACSLAPFINKFKTSPSLHCLGSTSSTQNFMMLIGLCNTNTIVFSRQPMSATYTHCVRQRI